MYRSHKTITFHKKTASLKSILIYDDSLTIGIIPTEVPRYSKSYFLVFTVMYNCTKAILYNTPFISKHNPLIDQFDFDELIVYYDYISKA